MIRLVVYSFSAGVGDAGCEEKSEPVSTVEFNNQSTARSKLPFSVLIISVHCV
jgi:hypothetical protein